TIAERAITAGAVIPVEAARTITALAVAIPERPVAARRARGVEITARRTVAITIALAGIRAPLAVIAFSRGAAPCEFLLRPPCGAETAFPPGGAFAVTAGAASAGAITPAAGIVVFVVVAGHEWSFVRS